MTTFATDEDITRRLGELDERGREAWDAYADALRELQGRDYEQAEDGAWERLQQRLHDLDDERTELIAVRREADAV